MPEADELRGFEEALKVARMLEERYPLSSSARAVAEGIRKELEARHKQMELRFDQAMESMAKTYISWEEAHGRDKFN